MGYVSLERLDSGRLKRTSGVEAGGSAMFNMSDIIMMQQPDSDGNKIPPGTLAD
jgi:hypothetical protein